MDRFDNNIIILNGDDFKTYYPKYDSLLRNDSRSTAEIVQPYSNFVVNELKKEIMEKGYNVMVEGTMRTSEVPLNTAEEFKAYGYRVEAAVVSVNQFASRIGCVVRAEEDLAINGAGRTVNPLSHDEAYKNIPNTLEKLANSKLFDNITIYTRDGKILSLGDEVVASYVKHREAINGDLYKSVINQIEQAKYLMTNRQALSNEFNELDKIKEGITNGFMQLSDKSTKITKESEAKLNKERGFER